MDSKPYLVVIAGAAVITVALIVTSIWVPEFRSVAGVSAGTTAGGMLGLLAKSPVQ